MRKSFVLLFVFFMLAVFACLSAGRVSASTESGVIDSTYKYAWGDKCGWINFRTDNSNVYIGDDRLTGYAWSEMYGWINLAPDGSGVKNNREGTLSGYAWGENTGWINFSGVTINSDGQFVGTASGDITGTISFDCSGCTIKTDWRPVSTRSGGLMAISSPPSSPPSQGLSVLINNGQIATNNSAITLTIRAGSDVKKMEISNSPDFAGAVIEDFQSTKNWTLTQGDGQKTVYIKFYNQQNIPSEVISDSIILDTQKPKITITYIKSEYSPEEEVILGGTTEPNSQISLNIDGKFGLFIADSQGNWLITLGRKSLGKHIIELTAKDPLENMGNTLTVEFLVKTGVIPEEPGIIEKIGEELKKIIPPFLKPEEKVPQPVITVPKISPMAFRNFWNVLPVKAIQRFTLSPLPKDISILAQKFPELEKTFKDVSITKITDVEKLKSANLKLPGLTETLGLSPVEIRPGEFAPPKGIPVAELSVAAKQKIPTEIVFATAGGGLVDFDIALSISNKGTAEQTITTVSGKPLQLVVKPDKPVKRVKGYIVFRAKKPAQTSFQVPLNYLNASLMFAGPNLAENQDQPVNVEEKLVLLEFEYEDIGNGVYSATVQAPVVDGQYEIITVMDYEDTKIVSKEIKLITVIDPEGYVYEKDGERETRILGAVASLYWLNPETKQYELWPAKDYQQENPQTTDVRGTYSFLVPEGYYYLKVDAPGYLSYDGKPFQVTEGSGVHINIELKTIYWWTKIVDWKIVLLFIVILLLLFNFYKDKLREKIIAQNKV